MAFVRILQAIAALVAVRRAIGIQTYNLQIGGTAPLTQKGFERIASTGSKVAMKAYILRLLDAAHLSFYEKDIPLLNEFADRASHTTEFETLHDMKSALFAERWARATRKRAPKKIATSVRGSGRSIFKAVVGHKPVAASRSEARTNHRKAPKALRRLIKRRAHADRASTLNKPESEAEVTAAVEETEPVASEPEPEDANEENVDNEVKNSAVEEDAGGAPQDEAASAVKEQMATEEDEAAANHPTTDETAFAEEVEAATKHIEEQIPTRDDSPGASSDASSITPAASAVAKDGVAAPTMQEAVGKAKDLSADVAPAGKQPMGDEAKLANETQINTGAASDNEIASNASASSAARGVGTSLTHDAHESTVDSKMNEEAKDVAGPAKWWNSFVAQSVGLLTALTLAYVAFE